MPKHATKTSFQPGQSGNPSGRPKNDERLRRIEDMAKEHSVDAIEALVDEAKNGKGAPRVLAANSILDRGWGKSVERHETGGAGAFDDDTPTSELEQEAKQILADAIKGGYVKALPRKKP